MKVKNENEKSIKKDESYLDDKSYKETCDIISEYEEMEKDDDTYLYGDK